jgi:hypothetical protein
MEPTQNNVLPVRGSHSLSQTRLNWKLENNHCHCIIYFHVYNIGHLNFVDEYKVGCIRLKLSDNNNLKNIFVVVDNLKPTSSNVII